MRLLRQASPVLLAVAAACTDRTAPSVADPAVVDPLQARTYLVDPPAGKHPWPQHAPHFTRAQYDSMLAAMVFANNFALFQTGPEPTSAYLHHGLDLALPLGTPIYAIEAGVVRRVDTGRGDYNVLIVEDIDEPGQGWGYHHMDSITVRNGQRFAKGTRLGVTWFKPYPHIHLDRYQLITGGSWPNMYHLTTTQPDTFFHYVDTQAPVFEHGVHYFRNESDSMFARPVSGPPVVHGDVDIVAGIRDPGEHGHPRDGRPDDRQAPSRIEYAITPLGEAVQSSHRRKSIDLGAMVLPRSASDDYRYAYTIFKRHQVIYPGNRPSPTETRIAFYVVTNAPPGGRTGLITVDDGKPAWNTAERDAAGVRRFPNGDYLITLWAWDYRGNMGVRRDTVRVHN